jgi:twitching motility protein PilT
MLILSNFEKMTNEGILELIFSIANNNIKETLVKEMQVDFAYYNESNHTRYRINAFMSIRGFSMVFRQLNSEIPDIESSSYPKILKEILNKEKGLILVCGPTGSGKTTTLAGMINYINKNKQKHIITIEDPIEYVYKIEKSLITQREVKKDVATFAGALTAALREDPDVILIGEMRDRETIKMALTAAETGHLVLSTLHTMSAAKTINRIIDSVETEEKSVIQSMLSTSLNAVILQKLFKNYEGNKRVGAFEILIGTSAIRNLIRENKIHQIDTIIQTGSQYGMITMEDYIKKLLANNLIDIQQANEVLIKK